MEKTEEQISNKIKQIKDFIEICKKAQKDWDSLCNTISISQMPLMGNYGFNDVIKTLNYHLRIEREQLSIVRGE